MTAKYRPLNLEILESRDLPSSATFDSVASPFSSSTPIGYTPAQIRQAYGFNLITFSGGTVAGDGTGMTIGIVDAYDDPNIVGDLKAFDTQFGLPGNNTDNNMSFFTRVNQTGGTSTYPTASGSSGWSVETSLDVEWAHAIAPKADILLVEANSPFLSDMYQAVDTASGWSGVVAVSMSWGAGEYAGEMSDDSHFTHANICYIASSGDRGAPVSYPSASPDVVSVGGTNLHIVGSNWSGETGWNGSGGGISADEVQPIYQYNVVSAFSTTNRTGPDVSYNAGVGVAVYDSYDFGATAPWDPIRGTSAGSPQSAALIAIADQGRHLNSTPALSSFDALTAIYGLRSTDFHDITTGSSTGTPSYSAGVGYDLVTGVGSPLANRLANDLLLPSPGDVVTTSGQNGSFNSTMAGAISEQWQVSTNGGASFGNLANGGIYSGVNSDTLTLTGVTSAENGYLYRAAYTVASGSIYTPPASLSIASFVVGDFPGYGVYVFSNAAINGYYPGWQLIASTDLSVMGIDAAGDVAADFPGYGLWRYTLSGGTHSWHSMGTGDANVLSVTADGLFVGNFPGYGVYTSSMTASSFAFLTSVSASVLAIDNLGDVYASFPSLAGTGGTEEHVAGAASWSILTPTPAGLLAVDATGAYLVGEFTGYGVYSYSSSSWHNLTPSDVTALAVDSNGDIVVDSPGYGVNLYTQAAGGFSRISTPDAWQLTIDADGNIFGNFGGYGVDEHPFIGTNWLSLDTSEAAYLTASQG